MVDHFGYEIAANMIEGGFAASSGAAAAQLLMYPAGGVGGAISATAGWLVGKPIHYFAKLFFYDNGLVPTIVTRICQFTANFFANAGLFMMSAEWYGFTLTVPSAVALAGHTLLFQGICILTVSIIATIALRSRE